MAVNSNISDPTGLGVELIREEPKAPLTPSQLVWRRFRKHRMAVWGGIGAVLLLLFIIGGSIIIPESADNEADLKSRLTSPNSEHWFGTDSVGRDVYNRIIYGGQISLFIGFLSVIIEVSLGTLIGGIAAYYGGCEAAGLLPDHHQLLVPFPPVPSSLCLPHTLRPSLAVHRLLSYVFYDGL